MDWWSECIFSPLERTSQKKRTSGITMVMDKGLGLHSLEDLLVTAGEYIDIIKLTAGTALLSNRDFILEKVRRIKEMDVEIMLGGTLSEIAIHQDTYLEYLTFSKELGCTIIEVADGSIDLPLKQRRDAVNRALDLGFQVITEVGKEEPGDALSIDETVSVIKWDVESGANLINIEGREFGNVGIYKEDGAIRENLLSEILKAVPDSHRLLWETPQFDQQLKLIRRLGNEVNLGNIQPVDVLRLETVRRGLIGDTFRDVLAQSSS